MINIRRIAFKVHMKSGILTRHKWVRNRVSVGDTVKDSDGKIFTVLKVDMVPDPSMELTTLERLV